MRFYRDAFQIPERAHRPEPTDAAVAYLGELQLEYAGVVVETFKGLDHAYAEISPEMWLDEQSDPWFKDGFLNGGDNETYDDFVRFGATKIIQKSDQGWRRFWEAALTNVDKDDGPVQSSLAIHAFHEDMQATRDVINLGESFAAWQKYCAAYPATRSSAFADMYDDRGRKPPILAGDIVVEIKTRLSEGAYQEFKKELYSGAWTRKRLPFQKRTRPMPFEKRKGPKRRERVRDAILDDIQDSALINLDGNPFVRAPLIAAVATAATASELVIDPLKRYHNRHADIRRVGAIRWLADDLHWPAKRFFSATPHRTWFYEHVWLGLSEKNKNELKSEAEESVVMQSVL